jgi:hypothetical protein
MSHSMKEHKLLRRANKIARKANKLTRMAKKLARRVKKFANKKKDGFVDGGIRKANTVPARVAPSHVMHARCGAVAGGAATFTGGIHTSRNFELFFGITVPKLDPTCGVGFMMITLSELTSVVPRTTFKVDVPGLNALKITVLSANHVVLAFDWSNYASLTYTYSIFALQKWVVDSTEVRFGKSKVLQSMSDEEWKQYSNEMKEFLSDIDFSLKSEKGMTLSFRRHTVDVTLSNESPWMRVIVVGTAETYDSVNHVWRISQQFYNQNVGPAASIVPSSSLASAMPPTAVLPIAASPMKNAIAQRLRSASKK